MAENKKYFEKLKDPRWQRLRLEILQRDDFACQNCGTNTETLHVHHLNYTGYNPWNAPSEDLITLCEECHETESKESKAIEIQLVRNVKSAKFLSSDIEQISKGFNDIQMVHCPEVVAAAIRDLFINKDAMNFLVSNYLNNLP